MKQGEPDFEIDLKYGEAGEDRIAADIVNGGWEIKTKRYLDSKFYLEGAQHAYGINCAFGKHCTSKDHWKASGVQLTKAQHYAFNIGETGIWIHFKTKDLRKLFKQIAKAEPNRIKSTIVSDNPTRGLLLELEEIANGINQFKEKT